MRIVARRPSYVLQLTCHASGVGPVTWSWEVASPTRYRSAPKICRRLYQSAPAAVYAAVAGRWTVSQSL